MVILAAAAAVFVLIWGVPGRPNPDSFNYDRGIEFPALDPALVHYRQVADIPTGFKELRAVAVGTDDKVYAGGDQSVRVFNAGGKSLETIGFQGEIECLAVASDGTIYASLGKHITVRRPGGQIDNWPSMGKDSWIRSIALTADGKTIFAADRGQSWVVKLDDSGKVTGYIGRDSETGKPNRYKGIERRYCFDIAMAPGDLLWVADPDQHRFECFDVSGDLQLKWQGRVAQGIEGFYGCCNPTDIAILANGNIVTSDKGSRLPRVRVYDKTGKLLSVVVGPDGIAGESNLLDLAVDASGRIYVIDPVRGSIRVFARKDSTTAP